MDVAVHMDEYKSLIMDLKELGYKIGYKEDNLWMATHPENIKIEILVMDEGDKDILPSPLCEPDYDVNTLFYAYYNEHQSYQINSWVTGNKQDVYTIFTNIMNNIAVEYEPDINRKEKMMKKGYKIIQNSED